MPVGCNKLRKVLMDKKKNRIELKDITEISFNVRTKMVGMRKALIRSARQYLVIWVMEFTAEEQFGH